MAEKKQKSTKIVKKEVVSGSRKTANARAVLVAGSGIITVNKKPIEEYLQRDTLVLVAKQPLTLTGTAEKYDFSINVRGGGISGQAGAICHAIAKALAKEDEQLKAELKKAGFLTRDARKKERKKYGLHKARKAPQFSKR